MMDDERRDAASEPGTVLLRFALKGEQPELPPVLLSTLNQAARAMLIGETFSLTPPARETCACPSRTVLYASITEWTDESE